MKISTPPRPGLLQEFNLRKQKLVFDAVWHALEDHRVFMDSPMDLREFLNLTHYPQHVADVYAERHANGFQDFDIEKLRHAFESCASMIAAASAAVNGSQDGVKVAFAPVSGFHHAAYKYCGGYCTFNGLVVAAQYLRVSGQAPNGVLIIDGDGHYGDGTEDIINNLQLGSWLSQVSLSAASTGKNFKRAEHAIEAALRARPYSLVMYQAGADAHIDDPYGAGYLTNMQWGQRDTQVFSTCKELRLPIVWNLAGGYNGAKTLNLHARTFLAALQVFYPQSIRVLHPRIAG